MKWNRVRSESYQVCSARGCDIPPGDEHWRKSWTTADSRQHVQSIYCRCCGDASRCSTGIVMLGPIGLVAMVVGCFGILPLVWPGHTLAYLGIFALTFTLTVVISTRSFFCIFSRCRQVQSPARLLPEERHLTRKAPPVAA